MVSAIYNLRVVGGGRVERWKGGDRGGGRGESNDEEE